MTSVPFQGGGMDTWGSYRTERRELVQFIRDQRIAGVIFLTGDYHLARDWSNKATGLHEFMAGPIASFTHYERNPGARDRYAKAGAFHHGDSFNFALVRVDPIEAKASIEWIDGRGQTLGRVGFGV